MREPALVIMAAGIGSRFGGLKQMAPVGKSGEPIIEFSLYDAVEAGFNKFVFIIKEEMQGDFKALVSSKLPPGVSVQHIFQRTDDLPEGYEVPEGREKPWGTAHAVLCAAEVLDVPFAVINADDYYGRAAFQIMYARLTVHEDDELYRFSMVGYRIENTLTEHGSVARGVCCTEGKFVTAIQERLRIEKRDGLIQFTEDGGASWQTLEEGTVVSMNFWGFSRGFLVELENRFPAFLDRALAENPQKAEFLLPQVVGELLEEKKATLQYVASPDRWYGVTYKEDLPAAAAAIQKLQDEGMYPQKLF